VRLYLVRHAAVTVKPGVPSSDWHLSAEGRAAAGQLAEEAFWSGVRGLHVSPEPKAIGTAERIAARHDLPVRIEPALREVARRWAEGDYSDVVRRYLAGETLDGWEPRDETLARVRSCIGRIVERHAGAEVAVVSHGLALTLYVSDLLGLDGEVAYELWSGIRFPDVAVVDPAARRLERGFGEG